MTAKNNTLSATADREILSERLFNAPVELVWKAWSDPEQLAKWWGPKGFTNTFHEFNFKPGGTWRFIMHAPNGADFPNESVFVEIVQNERIVLDHIVAPKFRMTATFTEQGGKTHLRWHMVFESAETYEKVKGFAVEGNKQNLDRLEAHLAALSAKGEFIITRTFNAPRELVWRAWTEPERIAKWFGPKGVTVKSAKMDLRSGGSLLTCMTTPDGHEMWGKWVFREIVPPQKLVYVNSFSDEKGGFTRHPMSPTWPMELLTTVTLKEQGGKTEITLKWIPLNATAEEISTFNAAMEGMKGGWTGTFDQLDEYLAKIS
jgi:uncharacterized protein YndB with AHSA1/START domain